MSDLSKAKEKLTDGGYTCVLCRGEETYSSELRGVKPLVTLYEDMIDYSGFSAADKVVGKATAFLYVLLGVRAVYAKVISRSALSLFEENGIYTEYDALVENIINRRGDGICPFEAAVLEINDERSAYAEIIRKMKEMNISIRE